MMPRPGPREREQSTAIISAKCCRNASLAESILMQEKAELTCEIVSICGFVKTIVDGVWAAWDPTELHIDPCTTRYSKSMMA